MKVLKTYVADKFFADVKQHLAKLEKVEPFEIDEDDVNTYIVSLLNNAIQHGVKV